MKKVNLFIAGEPKSGTSALYELIKGHPEIYMSVEKEPCFFCRDIHKESSDFYGKNIFFHHTNLSSYETLFNNAKDEKVRGEASTIYLYSKTSAEEIYSYNPEAKIIMMFREPVSFMHSLHSQYLSETTEKENDFAKALKLEEIRKKHESIPSGARSPSFLFYKERTRYYDHIQRFLKVFKKDQIRIILFEDFIKDNAKVLKEVLEFLEVDSNFEPDYKEVNTNKTVKYKFFHRFIQSPRIKSFFWRILNPDTYYKIRKIIEPLFLKYEKRPPLDEHLKKQLKEEFAPAVIRLNEFLKKENLIEHNLLKLWNY